jgi:membrane-associated protease RseP (regulator of RpoE activity)
MRIDMKLCRLFLLLASVVIAQDKWDLIRIGQTTAEVHRILGKPIFKSKGNNHFEVWSADFTVSFSNDRVVLIKRPNVSIDDDKEVETQTIFMPINFGPGRTVVFHFNNREATSQDLLIQRFWADGTLLDSIVRSAVAGTSDLRMDAVLPEPKVLTTHVPLHISFVTPGMPAAMAGLRKGDVLVSIDGRPVINSAAANNLIRASGGKLFDIVYERGGATHVARVSPEFNPRDGRWVIGVMTRGDSDYDLSTGWIRVVEEGKAVVVSGTMELLNGNKLSHYLLTPHPARYTRDFTVNNTTTFCEDGSELAKGFKCNGTQAIFLINLSDNPVEVGMCLDAGCVPASTETVAARGMIVYPNQRKQIIRVTMATTGYYVLGNVSFGEGTTQTFDASSTITFGSEIKQ